MLLEQLQDFQDILSSVLALQDVSFASSKDKGKLAFAQYISKLISYKFIFYLFFKKELFLISLFLLSVCA